MNIFMDSFGHHSSSGFYSKALSRIEHAILNWRQQQDAWISFHKTTVGRNVPRRAWMRHGAMLDVISKKQN